MKSGTQSYLRYASDRSGDTEHFLELHKIRNVSFASVAVRRMRDVLVLYLIKDAANEANPTHSRVKYRLACLRFFPRESTATKKPAHGIY